MYNRYVFSALFALSAFCVSKPAEADLTNFSMSVVASGFVHNGYVEISTNSQENEAARKFVDRVAQKGIQIISNKDLSDSGRKKAFSKLLRDNFDMKTIGRFSLGRYWRTSTPEQQKEYLKLFEKMVVDVYSRRFSEYTGQVLEVQDARSEGKSDIVVTSYVTHETHPDIRVDWRVRHKNGRYKVVDIIVEGVSMAVTQRSDFASVIQRGGGQVNVLLAHLKE